MDGSGTAERAFAQATEHHRAGRLAQARSLYQQVLAAEPGRHPALFSLGVLHLQVGDFGAAADVLGRAVDLAPDQFAYHANLGEAHRRLGRRVEAAQSLSRAVALNPEFAAGYYNLGLLLRDNGEVPQALVYFERAADLGPELAPVQGALADALVQTGELPRAAGHYLAAWFLGGARPPAPEPLVAVLARLGRTTGAGALQSRSTRTSFAELARTSHERALSLESAGDDPGALLQHELAADACPDDVRLQRAFARSLRELGSLARAVAHFHAALALAPRDVELLLELSEVLKDLGRPQGAAAASRRALAIDPACALAHARLAAALVDQRREEEALASCDRALGLDAECWEAHFQRGNALLGGGDVAGAIECFRRTIALRPAHHVAHSNILFLLSYAPGVSSRAIADEARVWARRRAEPLAGEIRALANDRTPERRLRVGYVSPDLRDHPVASFLLPLLEQHDRSAFEVICYASLARPDAMTERLRGRSDGWRDIASAGDAAVAELVREDAIDVLVDLAMHSGGGRPRLFARRPAPVQICWLAYVGTTGLATMDYRITDPHLDPPDLEAGWCPEAPLVLPDTFWCYSPLEATLPVTGSPASESGHVTFGCQHSFHKIHPGVIALWARVLRAVEGSRFHLAVPASVPRARVLDEFARHGVGLDRVELLPPRSRRDYFRAYGAIDICLDTFPYNGATTSLDAFWMGVPVVTLVGETPVGRAGLSIATNLGLPDLVARTEDEYVTATTRLAADLGGLAALRAGLRDRMRASVLMDAPRFARNLERAYRTAWTTWCRVTSP